MLYLFFHLSNRPSEAWNFSLLNTFAKYRALVFNIVADIGMFRCLAWISHVWHVLSTNSCGDWRTRLFVVEEFDSTVTEIFINLLRQSLFRDVVIVCHRSTGSPLSISFKILYFSWMVLWVFSSTSPPCSDFEVFWVFFNASISNVYVFEFLGRKHSNVPLKRIF